MASSATSPTAAPNLYIAAPDVTVPLPYGTPDQWRLVLIAPALSNRRTDWLMVRNTWLMGAVLFQLLQRLPPWPTEALRSLVGYGTTHTAGMDAHGNLRFAWFSASKQKS